VKLVEIPVTIIEDFIAGLEKGLAEYDKGGPRGLRNSFIGS
jgi:hypothetical protein